MPNATIPPLPKIANVDVRHVPEFPGYAVSSDGTIFSCKTPGRSNKFKPWREISQFSSKGRPPYKFVIFWQNNKKHNRYVHLLILNIFRGPKPQGMEGCHNDGNSLNNDIKNLRWDTPQNNNADKKLHGTSNEGAKNAQAKLTARNVLKIRELWIDGHSQSQIARMFSVRQSAISKIINGEQWRHLPVTQRNISPKSIKPGEENCKAKMTPKEVQKIRTLAALGMRYSDIAPQFGISPSQVRRITIREHWKCVN